jgi:hypothetical protein
MFWASKNPVLHRFQKCKLSLVTKCTFKMLFEKKENFKELSHFFRAKTVFVQVVFKYFIILGITI